MKYKTEICKHWYQHQSCGYDDKCYFAHGQQELRKKDDLDQHSNIRTKPCKSFHISGFCCKGTRCTYLHWQVFVPDKSNLNSFIIDPLAAYIQQYQEVNQQISQQKYQQKDQQKSQQKSQQVAYYKSLYSYKLFCLGESYENFGDDLDSFFQYRNPLKPRKRLQFFIDLTNNNNQI